ncbi:hypothetical protein [Jiangella alkaliphila]|uniref:Collagen-binding domain of a collagenase n=1 Tax=Jiangella alkaliphila TaxID=419479 RepID=A0A1H2KKT2_9ACTN|nr:hypothetical protein [Jiangella alkaliphila]SDU69038.1 hypothetical protein SAMN04488563_3928 [Jiangella alkaliphila]
MTAEPPTTRIGPGPLVVSSRNPRYFAHRDDDTGRAVYLTGSHIWNNLQDGMGPGPDAPDEPERLDFEAYLRFLTERGHNLIRLWRWEQFRSQAAGGSYHLDMSPQPWARTGPGAAKDGRPRFDLERFDEAFFARLRQRVEQAGAAGVYVDVLLFDGWALHLSPAPDHIEGHPFHALNNVNGVSATSIDDLQVLPLDPQVEAIQRAFVTKVVDTLHELPNVLWEVSNESTGDGAVSQEFADFLGMDEPPSWGDSTAWQYWVIDVVQRHERERGYDPHPIGMTMQFPVRDQTKVNEPLLASRAEWISPGYDDERFAGGGHPMAPGAEPSRWLADPPVADGRKVVISDTDHYAPGSADPLWAWKSFLRGHHPILMDFGLIAGLEPTGVADPEAGVPPFEHYEAARYAMGDTRRYAERLSLADTEPRADTASTGYALVDEGREVLVLDATGGAPFTVDLTPGRWRVEWFDVQQRVAADAPAAQVDEAGPVTFAAPFDGPAVLYLTV